METTYDKAALFEYMDDAASVGESLRLTRDETVNSYNECKQQHSRLHTELEQRIRKAQNAINYAESEISSARAEYDAASDALIESDEDSSSSINHRIQAAQTRIMIAEEELVAASAEYESSKLLMDRLISLWDQHASVGDSLLRGVEENLFSYFSLMTKGNTDIGEYIGVMDKAHASLYESTAETLSNSRTEDTSHSGSVLFSAHATVNMSPTHSPDGNITHEGGIQPLGWCADNSMTAVSIAQCGRKTLTLEIQGCSKTFDCTKSGIAKAYREAVKSGDQDLISRTSAMFEIETLRESLELKHGDPDTVQMGGYHRDVKKQDPSGYESHHIPARSVQSGNAEWLPTISITEADHKNTFSYSGKQRHISKPILPSRVKPTTYKQSVSDKISEGSPGYIEAVRNELLDLRASTGHKYDGGVSAYLDAVIDMLATRGVPDSR